MAGREKTIFFAVALLVSLSQNNVKCDVNPSLKQVEDCKNVCRKNFQIRSELKSCIDTCVIPSPTKNNGEVTETCIKDCLSTNPEGHALCELRCKNIPDHGKEQIAATSTVGIAPSDIVEDVPQLFSDLHARISKMMDCLMDGMRHQMKYGWASLPDLMDSRMDKFIDDAKFVKDWFPSDLPQVKVEGAVEADVDNKDAMNAGKEEAGKSNEAHSFGPILHRLIIIKKIPLFSYDENAEVEQAADIAATDSMSERLKGFFNNLFGSFDAHEDSLDSRTLVRDENIKSAKVDGEGNKKSNGKFCDFLSNMAHKSGLKRTTFILLMAGILLCFAWYCIATIINIKHHKGLQNQEQLSKAIRGDLEYLVPIEEKLIFFAQLDKEKSNGIVQAPSIPIKIKIQDV